VSGRSCLQSRERDVASTYRLFDTRAIFYRLLLSGGPIDRKLSVRIADAILDRFAPTVSSAPSLA
jgi:hypothetical protein